MSGLINLPLDVNSELAGRLVEARQESGYTADHVIALSGLDEASLARFECGEAKPSLEVLEQLCAIYKVPMARLLNGREGGPPSG